MVTYHAFYKVAEATMVVKSTQRSENLCFGVASRWGCRPTLVLRLVCASKSFVELLKVLISGSHPQASKSLHF